MFPQMFLETQVSLFALLNMVVTISTSVCLNSNYGLIHQNKINLSLLVNWPFFKLLIDRCSLWILYRLEQKQNMPITVQVSTGQQNSMQIKLILFPYQVGWQWCAQYNLLKNYCHKKENLGVLKAIR